jgi:hypothetical protein
MSTPEQAQEEWVKAMQQEHGKPTLPYSDDQRRLDTIEAMKRERVGVEQRRRRALAMGEERAMVRDARSDTGFRLRSGAEMVAEEDETLRHIDAEIARLERLAEGE